jgi:hypothetical protein
VDQAKRYYFQVASSYLDSGATNLDHKELLSDRGFLVYVTRAYPPVIPYVKGFHLTAEMWRDDRDADGWKLPDKMRGEKATVVDELRAGADDDAVTMGHVARKSGVDTPRAPSNGLTPPAPIGFGLICWH